MTTPQELKTRYKAVLEQLRKLGALRGIKLRDGVTAADFYAVIASSILGHQLQEERVDPYLSRQVTSLLPCLKRFSKIRFDHTSPLSHFRTEALRVLQRREFAERDAGKMWRRKGVPGKLGRAHRRTKAIDSLILELVGTYRNLADQKLYLPHLFMELNLGQILEVATGLPAPKVDALKKRFDRAGGVKKADFAVLPFFQSHPRLRRFAPPHRMYQTPSGNWIAVLSSRSGEDPSDHLLKIADALLDRLEKAKLQLQGSTQQHS